MSRDKLIDKIMAECAKDSELVTRKEAAEMANMELKAKECGRRYEGDTTNRKKSSRTAPLDSEKMEIIKSIAKNISRCVFDDDREITNIQIINPQKEITFIINEKEYSITLTKHREKRSNANENS